MYTVTRQNYYYSGNPTVEIVRGSLDYSGADMLTPEYKKLGEGESFDDPIAATKAAIEICRQWRMDLGNGNMAGRPSVAVIGMGGMGFEGEPIPFSQAMKWAEEEYHKLPKCDHCGCIISEKGPWTISWPFAGDDERFCSENCANMRLDQILE